MTTVHPLFPRAPWPREVPFGLGESVLKATEGWTSIPGPSSTVKSSQEKLSPGTMIGAGAPPFVAVVIPVV